MAQSIEWKIALIDDDDEIRQVMSIVLADAGYKVHTASDGESGINLCRKISPQIVITDVRMPGSDGMQVLKTVKKESPDVEVILITGFADTETAIQALQLNVSDFITKPVDEEELLIAVKRAQLRFTSGIQSLSSESSPENTADPEYPEQIDSHIIDQNLGASFINCCY